MGIGERTDINAYVWSGRAPGPAPGLSFLLRAEQIREQTVSAWHSGRKLAEPGIRGENVNALAIVRPDLSTLQRWLAGVVRRQNGLVSLIPLRSKVQPPLLHPPVEILGGDVVRILQ